MWIMTPYGFFSIVQVNEGPPHRVDVNVMQIRARNRAHLEALKEAARISLPPIRAKGGTDYPYRIITTREVVGKIMIDIVCDINYKNFKGEVTGWRGDYTFVDFLHKVWHLGLALTPGRSPRPGGFNFSEVSKKTKRQTDTKT